ncbi:hypothetical protein [Parafrankia sp. BMG5.11]|uniref:hypothetical protein n=1 Tax=Parafrankia sp. BMG5.11 TaxID=222540 RepID=UPI001404EB50|nr:hypothetical protein [Parafrankia sp. BMG5.11]
MVMFWLLGVLPTVPGRYQHAHDVLVLAIEREQWAKSGIQLARRLRRHGDAAAVRSGRR